jgi:predicted anti-sigma-YlaC factor YlaD
VVALLVVLAGAQVGCVNTFALGKVADAMSGNGTVYARDDDPELVRDALPFVIKTMEQIHDQLPAHKGLTVALVRATTSYGAGFIEEEADRLAEKDVAASRVLYARAKRLFQRGLGYGLGGLDLVAPGLRAALEGGNRATIAQALERTHKDDVPLLYWTAAAWGSAISCGKDDMKLVGELPRVEALMRRALALDEGWEEGAIHEFFITYEGSRDPAQGGGPKVAKQHFDRARALSQNKKLAPLVSYAESTLVPLQDKTGFKRLLGQAVATNVDADPQHRLVNIIAQRRAKWLLARENDLFAD